MTWPAVVVEYETCALEAADLANRHSVHHLPVVDAGYLVGVLCSCDLLEAEPGTRVDRLMKRRAVTISLLATVQEAAHLLQGHRIGCLPVVAAGRVCGIVTRGDLVRAGVLDGTARPRCLACGSHHHVRSAPGEIAFCRECLDRAHPVDDRDPYEELGMVD
jgi:CBS domain-containing protein